jgi:hypothetical protein
MYYFCKGAIPDLEKSLAKLRAEQEVRHSTILPNAILLHAILPRPNLCCSEARLLQDYFV